MVTMYCGFPFSFQLARWVIVPCKLYFAHHHDDDDIFINTNWPDSPKVGAVTGIFAPRLFRRIGWPWN